MSKAKAIVSNGRIITRKTITFPLLMKVETARAQVDLLKHQLSAAQAKLAEAEAEVVAMLEAGCRVVGPLKAGLREEAGSRRPEWKEHYLSHMEDTHGCPRVAEETKILEGTVGKIKQVLYILHRPELVS